jgi:hypothetical protein
MAISPTQAKALSPDEIRELSILENKTDEFLKAHYQGDSITVSLMGSSKVITHLIEKYAMAGWRTVFKSRTDDCSLFLFDEFKRDDTYYR